MRQLLAASFWLRVQFPAIRLELESGVSRSLDLRVGKLQMRNSGRVGLLMFVTASIGCERPIRHGAIITAYQEATCIPLRQEDMGTPTRRWDHVFSIQDGEKVRISGAQVPGGSIEVHYQSDGREVVAADAGDYIYPADVRLDLAHDALFVKAEGVPVFGKAQTWLFQFDLKKQIQITRALVDRLVLPAECPAR